MTFNTLGDKQNPAVLLIHGMVSTWKDCEPYGKFLADRYYVIMPTLDGHGHDGTDLLTAEEEAKKLTAYLKENGIQTLIHYPIPPHQQECYLSWNKWNLPVTEQIHRQELSLPISQVISDEEVDIVINVLNQYHG